jgi:hypothetical protein
MLIVGIDPGLTGAVARMYVDDHSGKFNAAVFPLAVENKSVNADVLEAHIFGADVVVLEQVGTQPGWGAASCFNFGRCVGAIESVLQLSQMGGGIQRILRPGPKVWKKLLLSGTKKDKDASLALARDLFPGVNLVPPGCRKQSHDFAEALLLAEYGRRVMLKGES